ncbi:MAG: T9SS type A sorting domain-containing protein [Chitinophagaceae bacterium]|nr:T9SS type A sorting domain-containing protein [Chitinophagaceae bacterium]
MKTNGSLVKKLFIVVLILISQVAFSQPDYIFKNSSLVSGIDGEEGASYRFPNVKFGIDAIVTIKSLSAGVTIATFDDNANGGFDDAFQPRLSAAGQTTGFAEFQFDFVLAGTNIPMLMLEVPATSIDVDGSGSDSDGLHEFDQYFTPGVHWVDFDMSATDLNILFGAGSVLGKNTRSLEKTLIDTTAKEAMFTVNYVSITTFTARIGLDNAQATGTTRQRSIYFQRFFYQNSFLPINNLVSFNGSRNTLNDVNLNWKVRANHNYETAIVEKSVDGKTFMMAGKVSMSGRNSAEFIDNSNKAGAAYYRLRMTDNGGKASLSNVLFIRNTVPDQATKLSVFPSVTHDQANVSFKSSEKGIVSLALYDLTGKLMMQQSVMSNEGNNTIGLTGLAKYSKGNYLVVLSGAGSKQSQKIILQ